MMKKTIAAAALFLIVAVSVALGVKIKKDHTCDISDFGGVPDGKTLNTKAFKSAVGKCSQKGGGRVVVGPGEWLTGQIHLESGINLVIEKGARLIFAADPKEYLPAVFSRFEGMEYMNYSSMIYANGKKDISVTGRGEIDGQDELWKKIPTDRKAAAENLTQMAKAGRPVEERVFSGGEYFLQPSLVQFVGCENVLVDGISIKNSPGWTIHPIYSRNVKIKNVDIHNSSENTDGIVVDSSRDVLVEDSVINSGDDAIAIKSGAGPDGLRVGRAAEDITIKNCDIKYGHAGLAIGSEMSGGVRNVTAKKLNIEYADYAVRFKSAPDRGGTVENVTIDGVDIKRAVASAIQIDLNYRPAEETGENITPPKFKDITVKNLNCRRTKKAATLKGLENSPLENIVFRNLDISANQGISAEFLKNEKFEKVEVRTN